jgi:hypothetical protein
MIYEDYLPKLTKLSYVVMAKGVLVLTLKVVVVKPAKGMGSSRSR